MVIPDLGDGGAQRQYVLLANAIGQEADISLSLVMFGGGAHESDLNSRGVEIRRRDFRNYGSIGAFLFVARVLGEVRPDFVLSWLHPADLITSLARVASPNARWIVAERDSHYPDRPIFRARKLLVRLSHGVIANSEAGAEMWRGLGYSKPLARIGNIVDVESAPLASSRRAKVDVLFVGRLEPQKNCALLIKSFAEFARERPEATLTIVGQGSELESLRHLTRALNIADRTTFAGYVPDPIRFMDAARIFVSLSHHEGMPNALSEAICRGVPSVVSAISQHTDLLGQEYPFTVGVNAAPQEVAEKLAALWDSRDYSILQHAKSVLSTRSPRSVASEYLDFLARLDKQRRNRSAGGIRKGGSR
jgi:glycosyltransferase involved in cell wall biosynthesis